MKNLIITFLFLSSLNYSYAQGYLLDTTFGNKGKVYTNIKGASYDKINAVAVQSDGKIIASGASRIDNKDFRGYIVRYNKNGLVDSTFANNGFLEVYPGSGNSSKAMVTIQKVSGKDYILVGLLHSSPNCNNCATLVLGRYLLDGTLDNSFGVNGFSETPDVYIMEMNVDSTGRILVGGLLWNQPQVSRFDVYRFLENGQPDSSFGINGHASRPLDTSYSGSSYAIATQKDGKILAGGHNRIKLTHFAGTIVRYLPDGSIDSTFGINGAAQLSGDSTITTVYTIAIQSDNKIVASAILDSGNKTQIYVTRLHPNGSIDSSFAYSGANSTAFDNYNSWPCTILVQEDDKIYVAGYTDNGSTYLTPTFAIARYTANGIIDSTFGVNGKDTSRVGLWSQAFSAAILPDKSLVLGGWCNMNYYSTNDVDFALIKYLSGLELGIINFNNTNSPVIYPNPVSSVMNLSYEIEAEEKITLKLIDMMGRTVQIFKHNETKEAGKHKESLYLNSSITQGRYILQMAGVSGTYNINLQIAP